MISIKTVIANSSVPPITQPIETATPRIVTATSDRLPIQAKPATTSTTNTFEGFNETFNIR